KIDKIIAQCRKPSGLFGRFILWDMNRHHSKLTDWGLSHVSIKPNGRILDVGCGGGRTTAKLAEIASAGKVYGIDYSEHSVAAAISEGGKHLEGVRKTIFDKHLAANMNLLTPEEHRELFINAGFSDVQVFDELDKGWICAVGRKSS